MIEKLNSISTNVWAVFLILIGALVGVGCMYFKQPVEFGASIIAVGSLVYQHPPQKGQS